jgi:hypothetical protein
MRPAIHKTMIVSYDVEVCILAYFRCRGEVLGSRCLATTVSSGSIISALVETKWHTESNVISQAFYF